MMHPTRIPKRVADPAPNMVCVEVKKLRYSAATMTDPVVSKVLDDDDLLIEIMVRLGFPTTLLLAALVCKRWFRHASNPAFLRRFGKLHPPRILGFYIRNMLGFGEETSHFVPTLPQPPELDNVIRRANFSLDSYKSIRIHIVNLDGDDVFIPMATTCAEVARDSSYLLRGMTTFPQLPPCQFQHGSFCILSDLVFKEEGGNLSYFYVWMESTGELRNPTVHVYTLQDGSWCRLMSITITILYFMPWSRRPLLVDNKIYIASQSNILLLDLSASSFSMIQLPQGVENYGMGDTMLSRADDDSSVYLIHTNELQLRIWLHKIDKWLLVDTICLHELFAHLRKTDHTFEDAHTNFIRINQVGKNAEYVFLQPGRSLLYLDINCRTLRKVYGVARDCVSDVINPFMMIWPPTFPALKGDHPSDAT